MADENKEATAGASARGDLLGNKLVLLGFIVVLQVLLAIGLTRFVIVPRLGVQGAAVGGGTSAVAGESADSGIIVGLEEIIVTLQSDDEVPSYLRINVNLEVKDQATSDLVVTRLPQLRDVVIRALSAKRAQDLITPDGNLATRAEIMRELAAKLPKDSLRDIYFSDLVIQ
jgi:flagellar FliL protein